MRAAQLDFEWAVCLGNVQRRRFLFVFIVSLLSSLLLSPAPAEGSLCVWGDVQKGELPTSSYHSKGKFGGYCTQWSGKAKFADVRAKREERFTLGPCPRILLWRAVSSREAAPLFPCAPPRSFVVQSSPSPLSPPATGVTLGLQEAKTVQGLY